MCSSATSSDHFTNFVQKTTGYCSRPARGCAVEPIKLSPRLRLSDNGLNSEASEDPKKVGDSTDALEMQADHNENLVQRLRAMECILNDTFSTISSLKNAYVQLQAAHIPYDAEKLQLADKYVIKEMKRLSELKQYYKVNIAHVGNSFDLESMRNRLCNEESFKSVLQNEIVKKDLEIETLKNLLQNVNLRKDELERRLKRIEIRGSGRDVYNNRNQSSDFSPTEELFAANIYKMKESARSFTKCLVSLMKSAQWDLDAAVNSIEPGIKYTKYYHKRLAFQSYVCLRMFNGFENENFYLTGSLSSIIDPEKYRGECFTQFQDMQNMEPLDLVSVTPDCLFGKFCHKKFLQIVHPKMEESFFGNFQHRNQIVNGEHPRSQFYSVFVKFAKCVWLVHKLAFSFDPIVSIFQVKRGTAFHTPYMENLNLVNSNVTVAATEGHDIDKEGMPSNPRIVGFTVMPGFRVGKNALVKCQVYVTTATTNPSPIADDSASAPT
eukprot:Gb_25021 [translate_table: standard]